LTCDSFAKSSEKPDETGETVEQDESQNGSQKNPDDEKKPFDIGKLGAASNDVDICKAGDNDRVSFTQLKGSEALRALKKINSNNKSEKTNNKSEKAKANVKNKKVESYFIIGRVNNEAITNIDAENKIRFIFFSSGKRYNKEDARVLAPTVLKALIFDKLYQQYAGMYKVNVGDSDVDRKTLEIANKNSMTVEELSSQFDEYGISMSIFQKQIKSRMLLQFIIGLIGDATKVTKQEMDEARKKAANDIKQKRWHLLEIVLKGDNAESDEKVLARAKSILGFLKEGFGFRVMAETVSQGTYSGDVGDLGWVREDNIEKPVLDAIKNLGIGQFSDVIKTNTGYKIVYVVDVADPGKDGKSKTTYSVLSATIQFSGGLLMQKDVEGLSTVVNKLMEISSPDEFEKLCAANKIEVEKRDIVSPDMYTGELIARSEVSGKPAILRSSKDENSATIMLLVGKQVPEAVLPTQDELFATLSSRKIEKEFTRNFNKMAAMAHSCQYTDRLVKIAQ
jgi:peptidyl-prolyl cis-trans isomerase SurA